MILRRRELAELLRGQWCTVAGLARETGAHPREIEADLAHIERSLRHGDQRLEVEPARCRHCGFVFRADRVTKPGKCPACRNRWISPPRLRVVAGR